MNKDTIEKKKQFHKEYIKTPEFEEVKKAVFKRDGHKCVCCQRTESLVCHHTSYRHLGQHNQREIDDCVTLCVHCHAMGIHKNPANIHWFSVEHPRNCDDLREVDGVLVRSNGEDFFDARTFKRIAPKFDKEIGRYRVQINGKKELRSILVAKAFPEICGEWFEGCHVHHINRDKTDDRADNLRVMTKNEHLEEHRDEVIERLRAVNEKSVYQYTLSGNYIGRHDSTTKASIATGISETNISSNILGRTQSAGGYVWKRFEEETPPEFINPVKTPSQLKSENSANARRIAQYTLNDEFVKEYPSVHEAARELNVKSPSAINAALLGHCGKRNKYTAYGFKWKYVD